MRTDTWLTLKDAGEHCNPRKSKDTMERRRKDGSLPSVRQRGDAHRTWEVCHDDLIAHGWCDCDPYAPAWEEDEEEQGSVTVELAELRRELASETARRQALEEQLAHHVGEIDFLRRMLDNATGGR